MDSQPSLFDDEPDGSDTDRHLDPASLTNLGWLRALIRVSGIGPVRALAIARGFDTIHDLRLASADEIHRRTGVRLNLPDSFDFVAEESPNGTDLIGYFDPRFPAGLRDLKDPPVCVWVLGELPSVPGATVVGTRHPTSWGANVAHLAGEIAASANVPTVSGLALGIDTAAHKGSLHGGGRTVAILGSGIDMVTPRANLSLAQEIVDGGGCIMSECAPGTEPSAATLVARNRLQAALGDRLIMAQCGVPSGTLHTVRFALELGRRIGVPVPSTEANASENAGNMALTDPAGLDGAVIGLRERGRWHLQDRKPFADAVLHDKSELEAFIRD